MIINDLMANPVFVGGDKVSHFVDKSIKENMPSPVRTVLYLDLDNAHRMVKRFLSEKMMSKEELAHSLDVTVRNLDQLFSEKMPAGLMCKINLPLVKLYCSTRW